MNNIFNREQQYQTINNILLGSDTHGVPSKNPAADIYQLHDMVESCDEGFIAMVAQTAALNELCQDPNFALHVWKSLHELTNVDSEDAFGKAIISEETPLSYSVYLAIATKIGVPVEEFLAVVNNHTLVVDQEHHSETWKEYTENTAIGTYSRMNQAYLSKSKTLH